jgi:tRNA A37 methylthiotransferase MiaB
MRIILVLPPSYADRQPMPHLGLACLYAFLADKGIKADVLDLNIESRKNWYDPLRLTADRLYVDELLDLPLASILLQQARRGNLARRLLDGDDCSDFCLEYALEFGIPPRELAAQIHYFNLLALAFSRRLLAYDVVCFTLYRSNFYTTVLLALLLREQKPQVKIVIGGPQVSQSELTCRFLLQFGIADVIIRGEGEEALAEFVQAMEEGRDYCLVPGVMSYQPAAGFSYTPRRQPGGLDYLPVPDFSPFNLAKYTPFSLPVYASRGCPYGCSYCAQRPVSRLRYRSPAKVVEDLRLLQRRYRTRFFRFADSLMNADCARLEELADRLIGRNWGIIWQAYFRADITSSLARKLKRAALEFVTIGVESFCDQVLKRMDKRCSQADNLQAIDAFLSAGISVKINLIIAHPGESREGYLETLEHCRRLIKEYSSDRAQPTLNVSVYPFHISPGSPAYRHPAKFGIRLHYGVPLMEKMLDDDLAEFMAGVPVAFSTVDVTAGEAFKRFQVLNQLAAGTNTSLTSASLKKCIRDSLQPDDRLSLTGEPTGRIKLGEPAAPINLYLPIEKIFMELPPFAQTIFNALGASGELSVSGLSRQVASAHPEVQQAEVLELLAGLIHNQIVRLYPA